jgi:ATP-dependent RNA helicase HelY
VSPGSTTALETFAAGYPFGLDPFQREACAALADGQGVLVAAPTGAGKTVVGEFAVHLALASGRRCFYTTPIKALSNQKFADLTARHGAANVGLLTGDTARNGDAPVVVMTTEVLRNMLYAGSASLTDLAYVVMDEVHYLADRDRGAVWEEVIIHLPRQVHIVSLSATVSNAEEFADWLVTVRGHTTVIVSEHRPVPLWQHVLVGRDLYDLFVEPGTGERAGITGAGPAAPPGAAATSAPATPAGTAAPGAGASPSRPRVNPDLVRLAREETRPPDRRHPGRGSPRRRIWAPGRPEVIDRLDREGLLPAITFVFSRAGCDAAVAACLRAGLRLTTPDARREIRARVQARTAEIPQADLGILGYWEWLEGLERGIAAHHAGMLPTFKEVVEDLFVRGLVKAVFATETLALGINMPARTVVLEKLTKWNGETHADITPGEYTQLTGRAGRRGIDVEGHGVVLWQPGLDPVALAGLASTRTYPLRSSFRPSYNMAVNLVGRLGRAEARTLLESSFAQFQADRAVVGLARSLRRNVEALAGYASAMSCEHGSVQEYDGMRRRLREREASLSREGSARRRAEAIASLARLRVGDVVRVPAGRRSGLAVILEPGTGPVMSDAGPRPLVLTADRQVKRLSPVDFPVAVEALARLRVPRTFNARSPQARRDLAASLRNARVPTESDRYPRRRGGDVGGEVGGAPRRPDGQHPDGQVAQLRRELRAHPVHGCHERSEHLRWADRYARLERETAALRRRVDGRTNTIANTFDRVCAVLETLGYLRGDEVTDPGTALARVYAEQDLLVVECLRGAIWDALTPAGLAAAVSALVYEPRGEEVGAPAIPTAAGLREALAEMTATWERLTGVEQDHRLAFLRAPEAGFVEATYRWASGRPLAEVLAESLDARGNEMSAGDFVRWTRQIIDLLDQVANVAPEGSVVRTNARAALTAIRRGVIAYSISV